MRLTRAEVRKVAEVIFTGAAVGGLLLLVARDAGRVRAFAWSVRPGWLLAGSALEVALLLWGVHLWSRVLACFAGPAPRFRALLRVWFRSTLAKYLPGSIWPLVTTAAMASRAGACPVALPASFVLHAAFTVLGAGVVAAALAAPGQLARSGVPAAAALAALPAAALLVHPAVLNRLVGAAARLARREAPRWEGRWRHGALFLALYAATWVGYGAAFSLFVGALAPVSPGGWAGLAGVNALAFVAGFVAVFAPGGVGVREAALALALPPVLPFSVRALIAATSRLWLVGTEVAGGALAYALPGGGAVPAPRPTASSRLAASPCSAPSPPRPGGTAGDGVELLPDSATALGRVAAACRRARHSVWIAQLAFDADCLCEAAADGRGGELLADVLVEAAREPRGVEVRVLLNGSILMNTAPALRRYFAEAGADPERIVVRGLDDFPRIMHAKLVVVDGTEAFLVGSPFVNGYWDDGRHRAADPNRTGDDLAGRPIHDVSARVEGPVVGELAAWFAEVWNAAVSGPGPDLAAPAPVPAPARPGGGVRVLRTFPAGVLPGRPDGAEEILEGYLEALAGARSLVYLENQYFSARPVREALSAALADNPELEVVLVLNQNPDITAYRAWQNRRLAEGGLLEHPRVGVFALWAAAPSPSAPGRTEVTQLFVHSKVGVVDDRWATTGTANLDGVSLHSYGDDFSGWPGRRVFAGVRNFDLNLAVDGGAGDGVAAGVRRALWSRHLGLPEAELAARPPGGWLPVWRAAAAENARRLARGEGMVGRVLPYTTAARPGAQLRALGIDPVRAGLELRFDPGWVEVLWSPGWLAKVVPEPVRRRFRRQRPG